MALNWKWSEKAGEMIFREADGEELKISLYQGNALLIMLYEYEDETGNEMYNMWSFWADEQHAKNCLGLSKGTDNIYLPGQIVSVTFYRSAITIKDIAKLEKLITAVYPEAEIRSIFRKVV